MNVTIDNRPLYQLTVSEFNSLLKSALPVSDITELHAVASTRIKINGIRGLAAFLDVSIPTAQKIKNQNKFPFYESGNKVYFFSDEINDGLKVNPKAKGVK